MGQNASRVGLNGRKYSRRPKLSVNKVVAPGEKAEEGEDYAVWKHLWLEPVWIEFLIFPWLDSRCWLRPPHCRGFEITLRHTTLGKTPADELSAPRRDHYLTTHNIHQRQSSMSAAGFETSVPPRQRPQSYVLERAATGIGCEYSIALRW